MERWHDPCIPTSARLVIVRYFCRGTSSAIVIEKYEMSNICIIENCTNTRGGQSKYCHPCRNSLRRYGITTPEKIFLLEKQSYKCLICEDRLSFSGLPAGRDITGPVIDHDHTTNKVRGIICHSCNRMLGNIDRNPELILSNLKKYLNI